VLILYTAGNLYHTAQFYQVGRGGFSSALRYIVAQSPQSAATVGGEHDFRVNTLVRFFARYTRAEHTPHFVERAVWGQQPPEWLLRMDTDEAPKPQPPRLTMPRTSQSYVSVAEFPFTGMQGIRWHVYRLGAKCAHKKAVPGKDGFEWGW
jgi:hypothetical protein